MSNSIDKHILTMDRLLAVSGSIILRRTLFTETLEQSSDEGYDKLLITEKLEQSPQVSDVIYDKLLLTEEFKLGDNSSEYLTLDCYASSEIEGISIAIIFPQVIPYNMEDKALRVANRINIQSHPCAISLKHDGRFIVTTSTVFTKYLNDEPEGFDALQDHNETVLKLLTELISVAKKLSILIAKSFQDTQLLPITSWESLVPEYTEGRCNVSPITNKEEMTSLYGISPELDARLNSEDDWRNFCRHDLRAFSIQSKKYKSIVWISYLGYRGSQWHVIGHYSNNMNKVTKTHKTIAHNLAKKYQELWNAGKN